MPDLLIKPESTIEPKDGFFYYKKTFRHRLYLALDKTLCVLLGHPTFKIAGKRTSRSCGCGKVCVDTGWFERF